MAGSYTIDLLREKEVRDTRGVSWPPTGNGSNLLSPLSDRLVPPTPAAISPDKTGLDSDQENKFQTWYRDIAAKVGINKNPDDPNHFYDYRGAYKSGALPTAESGWHWPSQFKTNGHPRTIVNGINTKTGLPMGGLLREPYRSELDYFKRNTKVGGMATQDGKIIINPYTTLTDKEKNYVIQNETVRIYLRENPIGKFQITPEQMKLFNGYGSEEDIRHTIIGRIISGDTSAGKITNEQLGIAKRVSESMTGPTDMISSERK
jgi:hypothetical protein